MKTHHDRTDDRTEILEDQVKMLMISEADQGFRGIFKKSFNIHKTKVLLGADLKKWFRENNRSLESVPDSIRSSIRSNRGAGLVIHDALPGQNGGNQDVVYLRPPQFGSHRFFLKAQPDPCGDGNPATCDYCSGCSGESEPGGIIHTCVCTESCDDCRPCGSC